MLLILHYTALFCEALGAFFIFMESKRLNETVIALGFMGYDGPPKEFESWYYHSGLLGFGLLLCGIIVSGIVAWKSHAGSYRKAPKTSVRGQSGTSTLQH